MFFMYDSFLNYLSFEKRYSKHTITSYSIDLAQYKLFLETTFLLENLEQADYQMLRSWILSLVELQISSKSITRKIATIKSYYKFLLKENKITFNPASRIKSLKVQKRLPVFIEEQHTQNLFEQIPFNETFDSLRDKLVLEILYGTGIRLAELIALKTENINLINNSIRVVGKGNKERIIPMHKNLVEIVKKYNLIKSQTFLNLSTPNLILTKNGKKVYPVFIQRVVKKYLTLITPAERKSPHVLRHTFATHLLNNGADLTAIKDILGHTSLSSTQIYTHNSIDKIKKIFNQAHPKS